jgi:hypothetical protein
VLDGLDGNEDFWDMAPSDDEAPTSNSTLNHSGKRVHLCRLVHPRCFRNSRRDEEQAGPRRTSTFWHFENGKADGK